MPKRDPKYEKYYSMLVIIVSFALITASISSICTLVKIPSGIASVLALITLNGVYKNTADCYNQN